MIHQSNMALGLLLYLSVARLWRGQVGWRVVRMVFNLNTNGYDAKIHCFYTINRLFFYGFNCAGWMVWQVKI